MKVIVGLVASISIVLAGCGGVGGSGDAINPTISTTFNLAQGLANYAKTGSSTTLNISGTCAGKFLYIIDPATPTEIFEGGIKFVAKTTLSFTFNAPCSFGGGAGTPRTQVISTGKIYYDTKYLQAGGTGDGGGYTVISGTFNPPVDVHVGDTGSYTIDEYYDSSKTKRTREGLHKSAPQPPRALSDDETNKPRHHRI